MAAKPDATVAVLTDLWPSTSAPLAGVFVRGQIAALADRYRHVVLVPRLLAPRAHRRLWGDAVQGWQRGWVDVPGTGRLLRYAVARVPRVGEAELRAAGARLALAAARERPRLVHGHFLHEVGVAAVRVAQSLDVPSVVTVHGTDGRWLLEGGIQQRFRRRMLAAACAADRVVVVASQLADGLVAAGVAAERVAVIPMGIDEAVFRPRPAAEACVELGLEPGRRRIVFLGRPTREKGIDDLAAAARELRGEAEVVVVGPAEVGVREGLRYVGAEPAPRVALWLASADVFCLPSHAEGMPVSVAEALACGRPVVATAVGGVPEQVTADSGLLVAPREPAALADALREALGREWDVSAIRRTSHRFWWSEVSGRLDALYAELLAS